MKQKRKHGKKLLSFLLTLMMVVGLMPMSVFATEWSGYVEASQLQAGDVLTSDVEYVMGIMGYTLTLASGGHGYGFGMGVKNSDTVTTDFKFDNYDGKFMVKDFDTGEEYVPYNENGMVDYWVVAAVDHEECTITLSGKGGAGDGDPVALGSQVDYVYYSTADSSMHNGTTPNSAYKVDNGNVKWANGSWYVLTENVTFDKRIKIDGTVNLVLCDGETLTANKGIEVNAGATLNIYAQSGGTGAIKVDMPQYSEPAAIGAGTDYATGTITIHGGHINAVSGYGAAIGGAVGHRGDTGVISIYGGTVYARNRDGYGAGIGCAYGGNYEDYTAEINILGGTVTGWCSTWPQGDGIGKSNHDSSAPGTINIRDGAKVYAGENAESAALTTASEYLSNRTHYVRIEADIEKKDQTVTAPTAQTDLVYDGTQRTLLQSGASVTAGNLEAEVMYQYAGDDSWYTYSELPTKADAGTYTVNYKVDGNDSFKEFTGSIEVTISPAEATITAGDQAIKEGEAVATGTDQVTVEGLQEGQMLDAVSVSAGTGDDAGKVIASGATILDANGADVTANYNITYVPGLLTIISAPTVYKVTWKNWNGSVLKEDEVEEGKTPEYSGGTPVKPGNAQYDYVFAGWDPEVGPAAADAEYTASFNETTHHHTFVYSSWTWLNDNGTMKPMMRGYCGCGEEDLSPADSVEITTESTTDGVYIVYTAHKAGYEDREYRVKKTITVTVPEGVSITAPSGITGGVVESGTAVTLTSSADKKWLANGIVVSAKAKTYKFIAKVDVVITVDEPEGGEQPTFFTSLNKTGDGKARFEAGWSMPNGYSVQSATFYRIPSEDEKPYTRDQMLSQGKKASISLRNQYATYGANLSSSTKNYFYTMLAVTYKDKSGATHTYYSEIEKVGIRE